MNLNASDIDLVILAVLFAAGAQAIWNLTVKSSRSPFQTLAEINFIIGLLAFPYLLLTGFPPLPVIKWVLLAIVLRQTYYATLSAAYKVHDFSLAYPIMRGLNPVFVTALGVTFLGDKLNTYGACGVALIAVGIVVSAFSRKAGQLHLSLPLLLTCVSASVLVSLFLLVDGIGVRSTTHDHPGSYAAAMAVLDGLVSGGIVVGLRQFRKRRFSLGEIRQSVAGGLLASVAFWIGIWAISVAPIGMVSALRETSIFFALLLSIVFLKEKLTAGRAFGVASILVGVILIRAGG